MLIFHKVTDIEKHVFELREQKKTIGFVPTMGALHAGHVSIIKQSKSENDITISSIFINPTQFNNAEDFAKYPSTIGKDIEQLELAYCDILFLPDKTEVYPNGVDYVLNFDIGYLDTVLEGDFRPGHFKGVVQVVKRLLDITKPNNLYLGQKDLQQFLIVKKMIKDLCISTNIKMALTLREENGLAMSSRNARLSETEKNNGAIIYETLKNAASNIPNKSFMDIKEESIATLAKLPNSNIEYFEIVNAENLNIISKKDEASNYAICTAIWLNGVRLIDNILVN